MCVTRQAPHSTVTTRPLLPTRPATTTRPPHADRTSAPGRAAKSAPRCCPPANGLGPTENPRVTSPAVGATQAANPRAGAASATGGDEGGDGAGGQHGSTVRPPSPESAAVQASFVMSAQIWHTMRE